MHPKLKRQASLPAVDGGTARRCMVILVLLVLCAAPLSVLSEAHPQSTGAASGSLLIQVRDLSGAPLADALLKLYTDTLFDTGIRPTRRGYDFVFGGLASGRYIVEATAAGFQPARRTVDFFGPTPTEVVMFFMRPLGVKGNTPYTPVAASFTPKAEKETQTALRDMKSKKYQNAQKHLNAALKEAPGNATVHYLMGMTYVLTGRASEASPYFEKALSLDPRHLQSLFALGNLRYQNSDYNGAKELSDRALEVSPVSWQAHWMLAKCHLRLGDFPPAREHAERALELGREKAVGAQLLMAEALAGLGENKKASEALSAYLQDHPQDANAEKIRGWIADLKRAAEAAATPAPMPAAVSLKSTEIASADALPVAPSTRDSWAPPDADATVPPVVPDVACVSSQVLQGAAKRAEELVAHLEKFSALEHYESVEIGPGGQVSNPVSAVFEYLVFIRKTRPDLLTVEEVREQNKVVARSPGRLRDVGSPAMVLIFHPLYQDDFEMKCEGLGQWNGQAAWLVHFRQRVDRPVRLRSFVLGEKEYPIRLRGRAWISAESYQVVHLETDLLEPVPAVQLRREHMSVDYQPEPFPESKVELWLPQQADIYYDFRGHFFHHYRRFSDYRLFTIDVKQQIGDPNGKKIQRQ